MKWFKITIFFIITALTIHDIALYAEEKSPVYDVVSPVDLRSKPISYAGTAAFNNSKYKNIFIFFADDDNLIEEAVKGAQDFIKDNPDKVFAIVLARDYNDYSGDIHLMMIPKGTSESDEIPMQSHGKDHVDDLRKAVYRVASEANFRK